MAHDAEAQLGKITAPTQITFGRHDQVTSTRFADGMKKNIRNSELVVFEGCAHAPIYENVAEFNEKTLQFLKRHAGQRQTRSLTVGRAAPFQLASNCLRTKPAS